MTPPRSAQEPDAGDDVEALELELLLQAIHGRYGHDFRDYNRAALLRRMRKRVAEEGLQSMSVLQDRLLRDPACLARVVRDMTIHVTAMFRDPSLYHVLRTVVVPRLRTYPFVRIWHAGCATGEEVYSLCILLEEEGILRRCRIYATDLVEDVVRTARAGVYPLSLMRDYTANYLLAGGRGDFSHYYTARYDRAIFHPGLRENVVFSQHDLVTDGPFNEFNLILCRNVLIYFNARLQERVYGLIDRSLGHLGMLVLGRGEAMHGTPHEARYEELNAAERIYRRIR